MSGHGRQGGPRHGSPPAPTSRPPARHDHAIEAVVEDSRPRRVFRAARCGLPRRRLILASNTSQFAISRMAAATSASGPRHRHALVQPAAGDAPDRGRPRRGDLRRDLAATLELAERYGKETVVCQKDTPGFITSRLIMRWCSRRPGSSRRASPTPTTSTAPASWRSTTPWAAADRWTFGPGHAAESRQRARRPTGSASWPPGPLRALVAGGTSAAKPAVG